MKIVLIVMVVLVSSLAYADIYVCLDKETGEVKGTVDIRPEGVSDWAKTYTMKKADESYRGLSSDEIKVSGGKLSKATVSEIAATKAEKESKSKEAGKKAALETLGLTEADIAKIKSL